MFHTHTGHAGLFLNKNLVVFCWTEIFYLKNIVRNSIKNNIPNAQDMSDEEKKPFIDMTEKDKIRYEREMQVYKANQKLNGGGDTPKGRKQKKKKDPNAPKRPQWVFLLCFYKFYNKFVFGM